SATATMYNPGTLSGFGTIYSLQPAHMYGTAPGNTGTFLLGSGVVSGSHDLLDVIRIDNPLSSPTFTSQTVDFGDINNNSSFPSGAPQVGSSQTLDAGDGRLVHAVWRNNALWTANAVNQPSGPDAGQATVHWSNI